MPTFEIAGISLSFDSPMDFPPDEAFEPFLKFVQNPDYRVVFTQTDSLDIPDTVIHEENCYRVHPDENGGYMRSFFNAPSDFTPYATARYDFSNGAVTVDYLEKGERCVSELRNSFFHIGFEAMLIRKNRLCLHASCVDTGSGGLLFSGASGIGKSTQAELWVKYRGAIQINGDRPVLQIENGCMAWGSPYAGSSRCYVNAGADVSALLMLEQSDKCSLTRLRMNEAFRAVWHGLTMYSYDRKFVEEAYRLTAELVSRVPVYRFACTPDRAAVDFLDGELRKEGLLRG